GRVKLAVIRLHRLHRYCVFARLGRQTGTSTAREHDQAQDDDASLAHGRRGYAPVAPLTTTPPLVASSQKGMYKYEEVAFFRSGKLSLAGDRQQGGSRRRELWTRQSISKSWKATAVIGYRGTA